MSVPAPQQMNSTNNSVRVVPRLPPEVNVAVFAKNLPYSTTPGELYELFGKYGAIRQVRLGELEGKTKGRAYVVYEHVLDAKAAVEHLSGFCFKDRYLVVTYSHELRQQHLRR